MPCEVFPGRRLWLQDGLWILWPQPKRSERQRADAYGRTGRLFADAGSRAVCTSACTGTGAPPGAEAWADTRVSSGSASAATWPDRR